MTKQTVFQQEHEKLVEIFKDIEDGKRKLVDGLITDAAFLFAENYILRELLKETGTVKVHPDYKEIQKPIPAAEQYRKNLASYTIVIKTLNSILQQNVIEDDEGLDDYE